MPAHIEAPLASTDTDSWEPPAFLKGDIARALFYMATRYTGDVTNEPALLLTDATGQISSTTNFMGKLSTLLLWNAADPVDAAEELRNDLVYGYQTNRNPFVDHPEWVNLTFAPPFTNQPVLHIAAAPPMVTVWWVATNQSTHLDAATSLPGAWSTVATVPVLTNGYFKVVVTNILGCEFFRLRVP
jgi:hypothetical protein